MHNDTITTFDIVGHRHAATMLSFTLLCRDNTSTAIQYRCFVILYVAIPLHNYIARYVAVTKLHDAKRYHTKASHHFALPNQCHASSDSTKPWPHGAPHCYAIAGLNLTVLYHRHTKHQITPPYLGRTIPDVTSTELCSATQNNALLRLITHTLNVAKVHVAIPQLCFTLLDFAAALLDITGPMLCKT